MATTISNTQTKDKLMLSPDRGERSLVSGEDFRRFASLIGEYYHSDSLDDSQIHSVMEYSYSLTDSIANGFGGHPFTINSQYTDELELIADGHIKKDGTLSAKSQDANRLFALGVYAYIEQHVHVDDSENATLKRLEEGYFSTSPNIISYVGGIGEQISVLAFAERSKAGRRLSSNTRGEIIYTGCLYDDYEDGLVAELKRGYDNQRSLPARISYINTVERLSNEAIGDGEWTEPFTLGGRELCGLVRDDETQHPLVRIMADQYEYSIAATYASEYIFYDDYEPSHQELAETDAQRRSETVAEQGTIHDKYPRASQSLYLEQVASNAAIGLDGGIVDTLFLDSGREINIAAPDELSVEDATLVSVLYKPSVRAEVEEQLGLSLGQLKFEEQHQLLRYMANTDELSYKRLCTRLSQMEKQERVEFAKVFLATEFGDDYGLAILDISEHTTDKQSEHIFGVVNSLRARTSEFGNMFKAIDLEFANATEKALNERITDAIIALQVIVTKGQLHEDVAPHQKNADYTDDGRFAIKVDTIDEAIEIIEGLEKTFDTMRQIVVADDLKINKVNSKEDQFVLYRAMSKRVGNMLLYIRPEGAYGYDRQVEYGNSKGVEASISFIVDPFNPHKLMLPKDSNGVSIRFDREGRLVDEDPATDMRDPTRQEGLISVDVSSVMGPPDSIPVKIGRFIAAGNRIRARRQGTDDSLHHNTNYFDQEKYGDADGFGDLARNVAHQIELMKQTLRAKQIGKSASSKIRSAAQEQVDLPEAA